MTDLERCIDEQRKCAEQLPDPGAALGRTPAMPIYSEETATVYRACNGRRYFSKRAAIHRYAIGRVFDRYPCECEAEVGYTCPSHRGKDHLGQDNYFERLLQRFERWLRRHASQRKTRSTRND